MSFSFIFRVPPSAGELKRNPVPALLLPPPPCPHRLLIILCCPRSPKHTGGTDRALLVDTLADIASSSSRKPNDMYEDATYKLAAACGESSQTPSTTLEEVRMEVGAKAEAGAGGKEESGEEHRARFELLIASDVIYSVSVVAPLFHTVSGLLSRGDGPTGLRKSLSSGEEPQEEQAPMAECSAAAGCDSDNDSAIAASVPAVKLYSPRAGDIPGVDSLPDSGGSAAAAAAATAAVVIPNSVNAATTVDGFRSHPHRTNNSASCSSSRNSERSSGEPSCGGERGSGERRGSGGGGVPVPVFIMSQSFGYEPETERAIDQACAEFSLVREVIWDELPPAAAHVGGQGVAAAAEADSTPRSSSALVDGERNGDDLLHRGNREGGSAEVEGGGLGGVGVEGVGAEGVGAGGSAAAADVSLLVSQLWRKGTKMQRFWRCA